MPNTPIGGWALCADTYCNAVLLQGALHPPCQCCCDYCNSTATPECSDRPDDCCRHGNAPCSRHCRVADPSACACVTTGGAVVGRWYTVSLSITDGVASGAVDGASVFAGVPVGPSARPQPQPANETKHCVANTTIVTNPGKVIVGGDYRQVALPGAGNTAADFEACAAACCGEARCTAWAVAKGKCWLKSSGWSLQAWASKDRGEDAYAVKPGSAPGSAASTVPPSGWAGIVATLGHSQVDNFKLAGTAVGGAAAAPCATAAPQDGSALVSTPCDYPGTVAGWTVAPAGGAITLGQRNSQARAPSGAPPAGLCIGAGSAPQGGAAGSTNVASPPAITLVACGSADALLYNATTGQISPQGRAGQQCLAAVQKQQTATAAPGLILTACGGLPNDSQQFQFNPSTGALRQKDSSCIAEDADNVLNYRDCCVAFCEAVEHAQG